MAFWRTARSLAPASRQWAAPHARSLSCASPFAPGPSRESSAVAGLPDRRRNHGVRPLSAIALDPSVVSLLTVAPPVLVQLVFLSPLPAVKKFVDDGTTGDVSVMPYAMMCANGCLWGTYGLLLENPTIWAPNVTAVVAGAAYVAAFVRYQAPTASVAPYVGASAGLVGAAGLAVAVLDHASATAAVGYLGCGVCVGMFGGPLAAMGSVLRTKSAAAIPLGFTVFSTVNTAAWLGYGALVLGDPFIWFPNVLGLGASLAQLGLVAKFGSAPPPPIVEADAPEGGK